MSNRIPKRHQPSTFFGDPERASNNIQEAAYTLGAACPPAGAIEPALGLLWKEAKRRSGGANDNEVMDDITSFVRELHTLTQSEDHGDRAYVYARLRARIIKDAWTRRNGFSKPSRK